MSVSFLIPTHREDRPLKRCLDSLAPQLGAEDECIVIGDTLDGPLPGVEVLVGSYGQRYRYVDHNAGRHTWGHDQINEGIRHATGEWLAFNDDDDIWTPSAVASIHRITAIAGNAPILFRFHSYHGGFYWQAKGVFAQDFIGGHCIVCPNIPGKIGVWSQRYQGDWDFIESTVNLLGGVETIIWRPEVIALARP